MNRFFVNPSQVDIDLNEIVIAGDDVKHISKVLRLSSEDEIEICDGESWEYIGSIKSISKDEVIVSIIHKEPLKTEAELRVILYQGLPKGAKMELILQKTTEMGIAEIVPIITDRAVVQLKDTKDKEKKAERWYKIAEEAAKQSKRGIIPEVHIPISFKEALKQGSTNDLNILAYEKESVKGLRNLLSQSKDKGIKRIGIWIGPEGGFTEEEIRLALDNNVNTVTLGPRILRTETAGFALLSMVMYELGDLGGN